MSCAHVRDDAAGEGFLREEAQSAATICSPEAAQDLADLRAHEQDSCRNSEHSGQSVAGPMAQVTAPHTAKDSACGASNISAL